MTLSEQEVRHIARLARLRVTEEEVSLYRDQLGRILESMAELKEVDTSGVPPTSSGFGAAQALREDQAEVFPDPEALIAAAPEREGTFIKVRRVIE